MKIKENRIGILIGIIIFAMIWLLIAPGIADARGGGGRSFGGSRGFSRPSSRPSFGGTRKSTQSLRSTPRTNRGLSSQPGGFSGPRTSFGGTRLSSGSNYTAKYGVPRKSEPMQYRDANGYNHNYVVHNYGGYGSGLMTGYLLGHTSWMWYMPFHPAFYYSQPYYVNNPDGTQGVYPPTFSWGKFFFTILIVGGVVFIIYRIVKSRRGVSYSQSSFS